MGVSGSKTKSYWPFSGSGGGDEAAKEGGEQALARVRNFPNGTPFVFTRRSSKYFDEDGDLAHEFYEETVVTKNGRKRAKLKRIHKNLIPQGIIKLDHPCLHVDFPVVICEV
ncbi:tumor suppressor 2, mitochondrial calcium regulator b [Ictalurus furcatus]|uniref:tumor suppressor 2, mitochondrial calcium regulator b n=1 Tax=Ictalurus furcatus TaxID=66913 RepID=UPI002350F161|nr:tumor suppressor 2, mitochondrial calcium regulator b [Ictalurus furcatus]